MKTPAPIPEDLAGHLAIERFGSTAEKVRATAALIAAADTCWEKGTITAFQTQHKSLNPKALCLGGHPDTNLVYARSLVDSMIADPSICLVPLARNSNPHFPAIFQATSHPLPSLFLL